MNETTIIYLMSVCQFIRVGCIFADLFLLFPFIADCADIFLDERKETSELSKKETSAKKSAIRFLILIILFFLIATFLPSEEVFLSLIK